MRKGAKAYVAANFVTQLFALVRFSLLARLLGAHELGLAAMLILTAAFFQTVSATGSDRFIVQDKDGDTPEMQGVVQMILATRGVVIAIGMVLFSDLVAIVFGSPELKTPLMLFALAPLISGFMHLDLRRVQRHSDFRPESLGMLISETVALAVTLTTAYFTRDAASVVYGLVARAIALTAVSHITAKRPYRFAWVREQATRFSTFATPMFLNGVLLFFGSQGDRVLVANTLGAETLGHYAAVLLLIYYPTTMLIRMVVGFYLPPLARARDNPERYAEECNRLGGRITLLSIAMVVGFALVAPIATPLLYGPQFIEPLHLFGMIGALQTARFLRVWPNTLANSIGRSSIMLYTGIVRILSLPFAFAVSYYFKTLEAIIIVFIIGEIGAILAAVWLLYRAGTVGLRREATRVGMYLLWIGLVCTWTWEIEALQPLEVALLSAASLVAIALVFTERVVIVEGVGMVGERLTRLRKKFGV